LNFLKAELVIVRNTACGDCVLGLGGVNGLLALERVGVFAAMHGVGDLVNDKAAKGGDDGHYDKDLDQGIPTAPISVLSTAKKLIVHRHEPPLLEKYVMVFTEPFGSNRKLTF